MVSADAPESSLEETAAQPGAKFPRTARLLKHSDFERVYKQGQRLFSAHMTVFYLRRTEAAATAVASSGRVMPEVAPEAAAPKGARIGFTVGRVLGGAVDRNRIKRRMREAVRMRRSVLTACSVDVVMNPKKSVLKSDFTLIVAETGKALETIAKKLALKQI